MKTYPLTTQQFNALRTHLLLSGIQIPSDGQGIIAFKGIQLKYNYDGTTLTLSILKRPMLISPTLIWGQIDQWLQS